MTVQIEIPQSLAEQGRLQMEYLLDSSTGSVIHEQEILKAGVFFEVRSRYACCIHMCTATVMLIAMHCILIILIISNLYI